MSVKLTKYTIDRRDLFKLTSLGIGGLYLSNLDAFAADTVCEDLTSNKLVTKPSDYTEGVRSLGDDSANFYFFIDGTYTNYFLQTNTIDSRTPVDLKTIAVGNTLKSYSELTAEEKNSLRILTKARVSIHCEFEQTADSHIEAVMLSDASHRILAMRRLTPEDFILNGTERKTPYVVFDRLNLLEGAAIYVTYVRRKGGNATIFQYRIDGRNAGPSRLDFEHLPSLARSQLSTDFLNSIRGGKPESEADLKQGEDKRRGMHSYWLTGKAGIIATDPAAAAPAFPFEGYGGYVSNAYFNQRDVPLHSVRARINSIDSNGNFNIQIAKMHGDLSIGHYMRYFLVLDPVGRIMGGLRRSGTASANASGSPVFVENTVYETSTGNNKSLGAFTVKNGFVENAAPDNSLITPMNFRVTNYKITDMPYVQIITEDILDAIGRISLRVR